MWLGESVGEWKSRGKESERIAKIEITGQSVYKTTSWTDKVNPTRTVKTAVTLRRAWLLLSLTQVASNFEGAKAQCDRTQETCSSFLQFFLSVCSLV